MKDKMLIESRTRRATKNISYALLNQMMNVILAFVLRTVFIQSFGVTYLGLNSIFSDILGLLSMADLGLGTAMVYSYYKPLADTDYRKLAALTSFYKKIYSAIAIIVAIIGILITPFVPLLINTTEEIPHIYIYYWIALSKVVVSYLCVSRLAILTADQKGYKQSKVNMYLNVMKTVLQIVIILAFKNYILYLLLGTVFYFANNIIVSNIARREYPFINEKVEISDSDKREIANNVFSSFTYKVSNVLLDATDNILISVIVGTIMVGYYSNYLMVESKLVMMYTLVFSSLTASIGNLMVNGKDEQKYRVFKGEQSICYITSMVLIPCYVLLINDFIKVWLGEEFLIDNLSIAAIGINLFLICVNQPVLNYREATGLYKKAKTMMLMCAILNIVLSILLGKMMGLSGILFASAISRVLTIVWYEPHILYKQYFSASIREYFGKFFLYSCIISVLIGIGFFINDKIGIEIMTWGGLLAKAFVVGSIVALIVLLLFWNNKDVRYTFMKVKASLTAENK